jgi:hypothetical protein
MPQKKVTKLYTDEEIEKFQLIARKQPETMEIFLRLVGIIPTKSVMHKAKYRAGILSVSKMNELRKLAPVLFGEDKSPSEPIRNAYVFQKLALHSLKGNSIPCKEDDNGITYYYDDEPLMF